MAAPFHRVAGSIVHPHLGVARLGLGEFADRAGLVDEQEPGPTASTYPLPESRRDRADVPIDCDCLDGL